jgi:sulfur-oxidizing protein SoxB
MVDYVDLARTYGKLGGLDRTATLVKAIRAERGDDKVLFLDGGDTWQGSYTSLKTNGMDMVECMKLLKPDAMTGHWEFTFGEDRFLELIEAMGYPFLASNIFDAEWDEPAFEPLPISSGAVSRLPSLARRCPTRRSPTRAGCSRSGRSASAGECCRPMSTSRPRRRRRGGCLLSHNGFDVDRKLASTVSGST